MAHNDETLERVRRSLSRCATSRGYRLRDERDPLARAAVDAIRPIVIDAIEGERLPEAAANPEQATKDDRAYNQAIDDVLTAVRAVLGTED